MSHPIEPSNALKYAEEYPANKPEGVEESFFWVNSTIDDKPTIALIHRFGMPQADGCEFLRYCYTY